MQATFVTTHRGCAWGRGSCLVASGRGRPLANHNVFVFEPRLGLMRLQGLQLRLALLAAQQLVHCGVGACVHGCSSCEGPAPPAANRQALMPGTPRQWKAACMSLLLPARLPCDRGGMGWQSPGQQQGAAQGRALLDSLPPVNVSAAAAGAAAGLRAAGGVAALEGCRPGLPQRPCERMLPAGHLHLSKASHRQPFTQLCRCVLCWHILSHVQTD